MAKLTAISVYEHIQKDGKWTYLKTGAKARTKLTTAQRHQKTDGKFVLSFYLNGKKQFRPTTNNRLADAHKEAESLQAEILKGEVESNFKQGAIDEAVTRFLAKLKRDKKSDLTIRMYKRTLTDFQDWGREQRPRLLSMVKITEEAIMGFVDSQRKEKNWADRTAHNNRVRVDKFYQVMMKTAVGLTKAEQTPWTPKDPVVYSEADIKTFLAACDPEYVLAFETLYQTGLRIAELSYLEWTDLDFAKKTFFIHEKPGFVPKKRKERKVRVPDELMARLEAAKKPTGYVFGSGKVPFSNWWYVTQRIAKKAGLDATQWQLHRFRATYVTKVLNDRHLSLAQVMKQVGHDSLAATQRYWAAKEVEGAEFDGVNQSFGTKKAPASVTDIDLENEDWEV